MGEPVSPDTRQPTEEPSGPRHKTSLRRRFKKVFAQTFIGVGSWLIPPAYNAYMWFVYVTSRVEHVNTDVLWLLRERYGGLVGCMWHQEVFMVAWSFRQYEGHTLASTSDFGSIITSMLRLNGFVVFRGGSTAAQRRRRQVLPELILHMRETPAVAYGITCDGSQGPPYRIKVGSLLVAHACHKPMITTRTWCKRRIDFPGWDHSYLPLPFNHIVQAFGGPYFVPSGADDPEVLEAFRQELENELLELTYWVHERIGDSPSEPRFGFPAGWRPSWGVEIPQPPFEPDPGHLARKEQGGQPASRGARRRQRKAVERAAAGLGDRIR